MAWENLCEDIEEEFSDNRRLGWVDSGFSFIRRKGRPPRCPDVTRTKRERADTRRCLRARARQISRLASGDRPSRCAKPGCCNLLPIIPRGGGHQRFCSSGCCKSSKWVRLKRAQRARRRAGEYASGARPTRCTGPGCDELLHPAKTKIPLYCSDKCGARARRHQRNGGTTGGGAARAADATGPQE